MDSEAVLQAIETNLASSTRRVSSDFSIPVLHALGKSMRNHRMLFQVCKIWQNFWLALYMRFYCNHEFHYLRVVLELFYNGKRGLVISVYIYIYIYVCMCGCIYIYVCVCVCLYIYIYTNINPESNRWTVQKEKKKGWGKKERRNKSFLLSVTKVEAGQTTWTHRLTWVVFARQNKTDRRNWVYLDPQCLLLRCTEKPF